MKNFLKRIAHQLVGIADEDLTKAEKSIKSIVEEAQKKKVSGIELTIAISDTLSKSLVSNFEVHPCKEDEHGVEQCEPEEAEFWSVYVRFIPSRKNDQFGGVDCIADCETEEMANNLVSFLKTLINNFEGEEYHM